MILSVSKLSFLICFFMVVFVLFVKKWLNDIVFSWAVLMIQRWHIAKTAFNTNKFVFLSNGSKESQLSNWITYLHEDKNY